MSKKKNIAVIFGAVLVFSALSLLIAGINDSYSIDTGSINPELPTKTFTTNYSSSEVKNYVKEALASNATYSNYYNNFNVVPSSKTNDNKFPLYSLMKNLAFPKTTESIELIDNNPITVSDKGVMYIITHGYNSVNTNNTVFDNGDYAVSDNEIRQYVTQLALWLYLYETKGSNSAYCIDTGAGVNSCDFYSGTNTLMDASTVRTMISEAAKNQKYAYLSYVTELVDEAKKRAVDEPSVLASINFDGSYVVGDDEKYIVTSSFTPAVQSNKANFMHYSIELHDPKQYGAYLVNNNNEKIDNTNIFEGSFKIYIPVKDSIDKIDLSSISVDIYGYFANLNGYNYRITKSTVESEGSVDNLMNNYNGTKYPKYTNLILARFPEEVVKTSFSLTNIVKISKVDITNHDELSGASLELTKKNDSEKKWNWVSTNKPHYLHLEDGEYELCETIAPEGYQLTHECITFTVDNQKTTTVEMENKPVEIPNTGSSVSIIFYVLGGILFGLGVYTVYLIIGKKEKVQ